MNNVYRVIWNKSTQTLQAVCEFAKAQGKSSAKMVGSNNLPKSATKAFALTALAAGMMLSSSAWAQVLENKATDNQSLAISKDTNSGMKASVEGSGGIAIGDNALAKAQQGNNNGKPAQNVAIGVNSETVYGGVAIGYKASTFAKPNNSPGQDFSHGEPDDHGQSVAIGYEATASGDQSVALGAQARAEGHSSIAIGGDDLDKAASRTKPSDIKENITKEEAESYNDTDIAKKYKELTGDILVHFENNKNTVTEGKPKRYATTTAGKAAVAIGVQSQAGDLATAFGTRTKASGDTSVALGVGASATADGSFAAAAGAQSTGKSSIALGVAAKANQEGAVAVGKNAKAEHANSVALGSNSVTAVATPPDTRDG